MTRTGSSAVRQVATQTGLAAAGTPTVVFGVACLTGNAVIGMVGSASNPVGVTPPSGWTEPASPSFDTGYATPTAGCEGCHIDSGFTSATVTWGSTSSGASGSVAVELDTSAVAVKPQIVQKNVSTRRSYTW